MKSAIFLSVVIFGMSAFGLSNDGLIEKLVGKLGVTQEQASGGAGAIFSALKDGLGKDDFTTLKDAVPGVTDLISKAPEVKSDLGGFGSMLGGDAKKLEAVAKAKKMFNKLGLDDESLAKYLPIVVEYVKEKGGDKVSGLIGKVFD